MEVGLMAGWGQVTRQHAAIEALDELLDAVEEFIKDMQPIGGDMNEVVMTASTSIYNKMADTVQKARRTQRTYAAGTMVDL
jgi:hypothetical protein